MNMAYGHVTILTQICDHTLKTALAIPIHWSTGSPITCIEIICPLHPKTFGHAHFKFSWNLTYFLGDHGFSHNRDGSRTILNEKFGVLGISDDNIIHQNELKARPEIGFCKQSIRVH